MTEHTPDTLGRNFIAAKTRKQKLEVALALRDGVLPVWVRAPLKGTEHYSGLSRGKLYELAGSGRIRSASLREPGQLKGVRLFDLRSILDFLESCTCTEGTEVAS